jgi:hypothetical protein
MGCGKGGKGTDVTILAGSVPNPDTLSPLMQKAIFDEGLRQMYEDSGTSPEETTEPKASNENTPEAEPKANEDGSSVN